MNDLYIDAVNGRGDISPRAIVCSTLYTVDIRIMFKCLLHNDTSFRYLFIHMNSYIISLYKHKVYDMHCMQINI